MSCAQALPLRPTRELAGDEQGAVMMMGLFMATFLIGTLWYMMGIGDALILHDRMQETADSVVFTSAAVHARGMNFIAAINVLMLAMVGLYIIMGIVSDILTIIARALEICSATIVGAPVCGPFVAPAETAAQTATNVWKAYSKVMKPALRVMAYTQYGAAMVYPLASVASGTTVGSKYKQVGLSVSPSMIPGNALSGGTGAIKGNNVNLPPTGGAPSFKGADSKIGLPVKYARMDKLCDLAIKYSLDVVLNKLAEIPVVGGILDLSAGGFSVRGTLRDIVAGVGVTRYCNDTNLGGADPGFDEFWGYNGPKVMWEQAQNGNEWTQVWSMVLPKSYDDTAEGKVRGARGPSQFGGKTTATVPAYAAQAEFYFDCTEKWEKCNADERAIFSMRWRVRLRRLTTPNFLSMLVGWGSSAILNGNMMTWLKGKVQDSKIFDDAKKGVEGWIGKNGSDALFGWFLKKSDSGITGGLQQVFSGVKGPWDSTQFLKGAVRAGEVAGNPVIH